jgi:hypothetical protein
MLSHRKLFESDKRSICEKKNDLQVKSFDYHNKNAISNSSSSSSKYNEIR